MRLNRWRIAEMREDELNKYQMRMAAFRAGIVALILATMVATFLVLAILALRGLDRSAPADAEAGVPAVSTQIEQSSAAHA